MPNFKNHNQNQSMLIPVVFNEQIIPGTLAYAINIIIDKYIDFSIFYHKYNNDHRGAPAYHPKVLLKIILYAYSLGIFRSRRIEELCKSNINFITLSGDAHPDHSSIAAFISEMGDEVAIIYDQVLLLCAQLDLIGGEAFALDGCKISSNAAKEASGTFKELERKKERLHRTIVKLIKKHKNKDKQEPEKEGQAFEKKISKYHKRILRIESFLKDNKPKPGQRGRELKSNTTDNDSAKMTSSHGTIQGYNGMGLVDKKHQIIIEAQAFGSVNEGKHLKGVIEGAKENAKKAGLKKSFLKNKVFTADTNYFTEENLRYLKKEYIDAYIPDNQFRQRDPLFPDKNPRRERKNLYRKEDFIFNKKNNSFICPAKKQLKYKRINTHHGYKGKSYEAKKEECQLCHLNHRCLKKNANRRSLFINLSKPRRTYSKKMIEKIDTQAGREKYSERLGIVEPVFANITVNKGLNYFTLRGKKKVNIQWKLYCMVHNIEKIVNYAGDKLKKAE